MRVFKYLPVLLLAACGYHSKNKTTGPEVVFEAPGSKPTKTGVDPTGRLPQTDQPRVTMRNDEADGLRLGNAVGQMPDEKDFKTTNPNLSVHKGGDAAVIAHPPSEKPVDPLKKAPGQ